MNLTFKQAGFGLVAVGVAIIASYSIATNDFHSAAALIVVAGLFLVLYHGVRRLIAAVCRPSQDAYSEGWESGYDKGWREGRAASSLRVVGIRQE